ncbi:HIT domain-containing protein [Frigoribacterium sp. PvP032]|uniref:HIT domain-containing protein n=1 Tax=Frigoribacterium sp. PvP032 TaxID=2806589 RepID=UPI001AE7F152|nr:HIT domain-containing protein [Frigoribacterium sp. PvP032]MBP1190627.1 histidine triad (HIT) family protein [Frigoribacterium sp. PvP032]
MSETEPAPTEPSVFSRIVAREIPADVVFESDALIAFRDIAPQAPFHVLVVPKTERHRDVVALAAADPALLAEIVSTASALASDRALLGDEVVAASGGTGEFHLIFNTGASAGQTVFHVHAHVLAGPLEEGSLAH